MISFKDLYKPCQRTLFCGHPGFEPGQERFPSPAERFRLIPYRLFTESKDLYAAKAASISSLEYIMGEFLPVPFLSPFTLCSLFNSWSSEGLCPRDFSHLQTSRWLILSEAGARLFSAASAPSVAASINRFFSSKSSIFIFMATLFFSVSHIRNLLGQSPGLNRAVPLPSQTEERSLRSAPLRQVWRLTLSPYLFRTGFYTLP